MIILLKANIIQDKNQERFRLPQTKLVNNVNVCVAYQLSTHIFISVSIASSKFHEA